jgi:hypothetical protein
MQCGAFVSPKEKSNSQSGRRTMQKKLRFLFSELKSELKIFHNNVN